ncbi:GNAT family N-acetyltransferase [Maridesulfovibrio sp. FT414]|uniref:GNAT family N-acetyltransferase n=1 Tax=Maridesulfovibrio sp. FT414 TaxID=2979469 RepID=UPI003D8002CC
MKRLQEMSNRRISASLNGIDEENQLRLLRAMDDIEDVLKKKDKGNSSYLLRTHRPGDIGYVAYRHAVFYSEQYGFDVTFDSYVASALAAFVEKFDSQKERLWIVEQGSATEGSIAIVKVDADVAQLRWFLVEPHARGKGLGKKMLSEAVSFCRRKKYKKIILWTVDELGVARKLYSKFGFHVEKTESHTIWGKHLTEELWEVDLE